MSAIKDDVSRIPLEDILKHRDRVENRLKRIDIKLEDKKADSGRQVSDLSTMNTLVPSRSVSSLGKYKSIWDVIFSMNPDEDFVPSVDEVAVVSALRDGLCLVYEMTYQLKKKDALSYREPTRGVTMGEEELKKSRFATAYSMLAASSFVLNRLNKEYQETEKQGFPPLERTSGYFNFRQGKENQLVDIISKYSHGLKKMIEQKVISDGDGLINFTYKFFKYLADEAIKQKEVYPGLVKYVESDSIGIGDEFILEGFNLPEFEAGAKRVEFTKVESREVVGNKLAKRKVIRYIDRLCLYDPIEQMNPCVILGGLSWTNLWDGLPGTGKTLMQKMAMTRLAEIAEQIGMPWEVHAVDQSVKDEFYGKTGKNLILTLEATKDPRKLHLTLFDDIDLLTSGGGRSESTGGADRDVMCIIMQYLDGAFTMRIGNNQVYAASNEPKGLESAVRNRFNDRLLIDGPRTPEDISDMIYILSKPLRDSNKFKIDIGYNPLATQDLMVEGKWTSDESEVYQAEKEITQKYKGATIRDLGQYIWELQQENPSITGRSMKAIMDAVRERSANFDIEPEFWTDKSVYLDQPFENKLEIIRDKLTDVTPDMVAQEIKRYAESEARYATNERESAIEKSYNARAWELEARRRLLTEKGADLAEVHAIEQVLGSYKTDYSAVIKRINKGLKDKGLSPIRL